MRIFIALFVLGVRQFFSNYQLIGEIWKFNWQTKINVLIACFGRFAKRPAFGPDQSRQAEAQRAIAADRRPAEDGQRSGFRRPHFAPTARRLPIPTADAILLPADSGQQHR